MKYLEQLVKSNLSLITNAAYYDDDSFFQSLCMPPVGWPSWIDKSEFEVVKSMSHSTYARHVCRVLRNRVCYSSRDNIDSDKFLAYLGTKRADSIIPFLKRKWGQSATALNEEKVTAKAKNFQDLASSYVKEKFSKIDSRDNDGSNRLTTAADYASLPDCALLPYVRIVPDADTPPVVKELQLPLTPPEEQVTPEVTEYPKITDARLRKLENPASFFNPDKNDATLPLMPGLAKKHQKTILDCCAVM